jgi:hypothetical protein
MNPSGVEYKRIFIFLFSIFILFGCNKKAINFDEYIKNIIFDDKEIIENEIYEVQNLEYKAQTIYSENGTHFNIFDNPNGGQVLFSVKYWTKIEPIEIFSINGIFFVKIKTKENKIGWIKSCYIELY